ncbi:DUF6211 family protein [Streptomyces sp. NPDC058279]|uniref:DUF6211 family protein n=1 Tax=Streptomyces sp. NPDC058279 TaxID=3346418 RepID=UPI0036E39A2B
MLDPTATDRPQPYDHVHLRPGNPLGAEPATPYLVVDVLDTHPRIYELWHLPDHPRHQDWAGAVTLADITLAIRVTTDDTRIWAP